MTPWLNDATREFFTTGPRYEATSHVVDLLAIALLVTLLIEYEVIRLAAPSLESRIGAWAVVIVPLVVAFAAIVVVRTAGIR